MTDVRDGQQRLPVFVYGTLRPGGRNHGLLGDRIEVAQPAVLPGARLHAGTHYPWIADGDGRVVGDLLVPRPAAWVAVLADLDLLEGHVPGADDNEYDRVTRDVEVDGTTHRAWTYLAGPAATLGPAVPTGDWFDHLHCP